MLALTLLFCGSSARADIPSSQDDPRWEAFSGIDANSGSSFAYAGGVWAFGRDVLAKGARLKFLVGGGFYEYDTTLPAFGNTDIDGDVFLAQLMAGYQWMGGKWTVKTYAGVAYEDHDLSLADPDNRVQGDETGLIGQVELWRNVGSRSFFSLDATYSTAFDSYFTQGRLGRKISQRLSMGLETAVLGNEEYETGRGGGFVSLHHRAVELTLSGGFTGTYYDDDTGGYGSISVFSRF